MSNQAENANRKSFWAKYKVLLIVISALVIVGLPVARMIYLFVNMDSQVIADTNGADNHSLNTITMADIDETVYNESFCFSLNVSRLGMPTDVTDDRLKDVDCDIIRLTAKSMNGIMLLHATKTDADQLTLCIDSKVETGNLAIVIYVDNERYGEVAVNGEEEVCLEGVSGKTVCVKAAGEDAKVAIEVARI